MKPNLSLSKIIKDGLDNSEDLFFLAEPDAGLASKWCEEELDYWCNETVNRKAKTGNFFDWR